MLLWFVSAFLLTYNFPDTELADLEIDAAGTVWLLPASEPTVIRLYADGRQDRFETGTAGLFSGLSVSPTGSWIVSSKGLNTIFRYDTDDILIEDLDMINPGDILFSGLNIWTIDGNSGNVTSTNGDFIGRNCASRDSRLCSKRTGQGMISGSAGIYLLESGKIANRIADCGSACFSLEGILLLNDGDLCVFEGTTLLTDLPYSRISASPDGKVVVLWGNAIPVVLE